MLVTELGMIVLLHPVISVLVAVSIMALQLFRLSNTVLFSSTTILVKPLQREKALWPMLVTDIPIVTDVKPSQPRKAYSPMLVTELGIVTDVKLLQP